MAAQAAAAPNSRPDPRPDPRHVPSPTRRAYRTARTIEPLLPVTLHPGQRHPTDLEAEAALLARERGRSSFPLGTAWEITEERAAHWSGHNFEGLRGDSQLMRTLGPLEGNEMGDLLWDLSLWRGMRRRGLNPPPLHEYLTPGREHWGKMTRFVALLREMGLLEGDDAEE